MPMPSRIPECDLCTSWRQTGPLEFEFQIREDAFFPNLPPVNGRRVTAQDIVFSYQRQMTPGWPNADLMSNIEEVAAFDADRLRIRLHAPDAEFFEKVANGRSVVLASEAVQVNGDLFGGPTLGSGPWFLEEVSVAGATYEANREYYGDSGPYLDGFDVQFIGSESTRAAGVRAKILDFVETTLTEVRSAVNSFPELQTVSSINPGTGVEIALNASRSPLDSAEIRKAIFLAWDLDEAMSGIWGGELAPSVGLNLPDPSWGADFGAEYGALFGDESAANALLNSAGLTPQDRLTIMVGEFGETRETDRYILTAESLAESLNDLGLATTVNPVPTRLFADNVWLRGEYDIFVGAPPPISSLSGQLFGIYHSDGPWNTSGFSNPVLDELIQRQATEFDWQERGRQLLQIQDEIMGGTQRFYAGTGASHWIWQPAVQDIFPDTSGASGDFLTRVWLRR